MPELSQVYLKWKSVELTKSGLNRFLYPQVKLLKKTASVKQLYNSVLNAIKTIASARDHDIVPELTKTFFENILRASDDSPKLQVHLSWAVWSDFGIKSCPNVSKSCPNAS